MVSEVQILFIAGMSLVVLGYLAGRMVARWRFEEHRQKTFAAATEVYTAGKKLEEEGRAKMARGNRALDHAEQAVTYAKAINDTHRIFDRGLRRIPIIAQTHVAASEEGSPEREALLACSIDLAKHCNKVQQEAIDTEPDGVQP